LEVDSRDLELLSILEEDARTPWARVARQLGVSDATVYLRIKKLVESGVLKGFTIRVDPRRLGLQAMMFALVKVDARHIPEVRRRLPTLKYVSEVYEITGVYHFLVKILVPSLDEASRVRDQLMEIDGVVEVATFAVLRSLREGDRIVSDLKKWMQDP